MLPPFEAANASSAFCEYTSPLGRAIGLLSASIERPVMGQISIEVSWRAEGRMWLSCENGAEQTGQSALALLLAVQCGVFRMLSPPYISDSS